MRQKNDSEYAKVWGDCRISEFGVFLQARSFELAQRPTGNAIDTKWVFGWKADELGSIVKSKYRIIGKGLNSAGVLI